MKEIKQYKSVIWRPVCKRLEQLMLEHDKWDIFQILPYGGANQEYMVVLVRTEQEEQAITDLPEIGTDKTHITSSDIVIGMKLKCVKSAFAFDCDKIYVVENIWGNSIELWVEGSLAVYATIITLIRFINDGSLEIMKHAENV